MSGSCPVGRIVDDRSPNAESAVVHVSEASLRTTRAVLESQLQHTVEEKKPIQHEPLSLSVSDILDSDGGTVGFKTVAVVKKDELY